MTRTIVLLGVSLLGVWLSGASILGCSARPELALADQPSPPPPEQTPQPRQRVDEPASKPGFVGVITAREALDLATEVEGKLFVDELALGDEVEAGQLVARIEPPTLAAELAAARAALRSAEATESERSLIVEGERGRVEVERALVDAGASASGLHERAELDLSLAHATRRRAKASVAESRAQIERLEALRASGLLIAPYRARVASWYHAPGEVVGAGERVVRLAAVERLWVRFAVPVEAIADVAVGRRVHVTPVPASAAIPAIIRHVAPELDLASQMLFVEAELETERPAVTAGQACRVAWPDEDRGPDQPGGNATFLSPAPVMSE